MRRNSSSAGLFGGAAPAARRTSRPDGARSSEAGYTMAALMVAVTILTVLTAMALPVWSQRMQREREEELIFRGWQYAEAIRVFQQRHGRLPTRLEELLEVEPRSIRKLWEDPMVEDGKWGVVVQVGGGGPPGTPGRGTPVTRPDGQEPGRLPNQGPGGARPGTPGGPARGEDANGRPIGQGPQGGMEGVCVAAGSQDGESGAGGRRRRPGRRGSSDQPQVSGPIIGVCSRSDEDSIQVLFGEESYNAWHFTVHKLASGQVSGIGPEGVGRGSAIQPHSPGSFQTLPRAEWIGRPFRPGIQPEGGAPPAGSLPGGAPPDKNRR